MDSELAIEEIYRGLTAEDARNVMLCYVLSCYVKLLPLRDSPPSKYPWREVPTSLRRKSGERERSSHSGGGCATEVANDLPL